MEKTLNKKYYVYIILCDNDSYYTGITNNLINRFKKHKNGNGANYTKVHKPIKFLCAWEVENVSIALSIEHYIKSKNKNIKKLFIDNNRILKTYFIREKKSIINNNSIKIRSINKLSIEKINSIIY